MLFDTTQLALERAISGAGQRHAALAANLANVNTPGYQRVDVDFQSALRGALSSDDAHSALETTSFAAQRAYEANVTAMQAAKQMFTKTLDLLR